MGGEIPHNPLRQRRSRVAAWHVGGDQRERVAAEPRDEIVRPTGLAQDERGANDHFIARGVAERLVEQSKAIEIEAHQREFLSRAGALLERAANRSLSARRFPTPVSGSRRAAASSAKRAIVRRASWLA